MNSTLARGALALGIAVACAAMLCAATVVTSRTAHADPGDNGGFDGYQPSDWDAMIAYLEAVAANEVAAPQEPAPAAAAPPSLPDAGSRDAGSPAPYVAAIAAACGVALIGAGMARRRSAQP